MHTAMSQLPEKHIQIAFLQSCNCSYIVTVTTGAANQEGRRGEEQEGRGGGEDAVREGERAAEEG